MVMNRSRVADQTRPDQGRRAWGCRGWSLFALINHIGIMSNIGTLYWIVSGSTTAIQTEAAATRARIGRVRCISGCHNEAVTPAGVLAQLKLTASVWTTHST